MTIRLPEMIEGVARHCGERGPGASGRWLANVDEMHLLATFHAYQHHKYSLDHMYAMIMMILHLNRAEGADGVVVRELQQRIVPLGEACRVEFMRRKGWVTVEPAIQRIFTDSHPVIRPTKAFPTKGIEEVQ